MEVLGEDEAGEFIGGFLGDWEGYCDEGVEGDWLLQAGWTSNLRFILPNHKIANNRLIPLRIGQPTLRSHHTIRPPLTIDRLAVRFILDPIQILMEPIDQEREELLGVVLGVSWEDGVDAADWAFDEVGGEDGLAIAPHAFDEHRVVAGELPFGSEHVAQVYLGLEEALQEVVGEGQGVG